MFKSGEKREKEYPQVTEHGTSKYPVRLNFYDTPPLYDVTLEEFETTALNRLRILAEIESSAARNRSWDELKAVTSTQCQKYLPLSASTARAVDRDAERRNDHLSHFVLRLAFCRSEDLRRRFVKAETTLFKIRYDGDGQDDRGRFLESRKSNWTAVTAAEKELYRAELNSCYQGFKTESDRVAAFEAETFHKVKWTRVPDLVERRRVFLKGGWAYVPHKEQSSIIFQEFEVHLERCLQATARSLPRLDEDTRLLPILDNLSQGFLAGISSEWGSSIGNNSENDIKAEMVDGLARKHFPLCMRNLHESLRRDHHLKHFGRLQYGLFLKVLGLSIEEAVAFWRKSFSKITDDKFNKEYKYNIRHSYGLEGKRANYPAKSCQQILIGSPAEQGACPYRHYSPENLQTALLSSYSSQGLGYSDLPEILAIIKGSHFHVACTRVFEITHSSCGGKKGDGVGGGESVTHPNQYAARSMELHKAKAESATKIAKDEPMVK